VSLVGDGRRFPNNRLEDCHADPYRVCSCPRSRGSPRAGRGGASAGEEGATAGEEGAEIGGGAQDGGAAIAEAERHHWRGVVAVVDDGGWLILLERMDRAAMTASVELAAGKTRAAALFKKPSQELEEAISRGRYAAITARGFIEMQGALPVVIDGEVIGAIGASFATPEQDVQVAQAGLAALAQ
jgi:glc operon protein GlcG